MKKLLSLVLLCGLLLTGCGARGTAGGTGGWRLRIVATVFPAYDFARAAAGELADVELLLAARTESHSYDPHQRIS